VDEWFRSFRALQKSDRVVQGSQMQDVLNPLIGYLAKLESMIRSIEKELGMGPLGRASLAIEGGEAQLTAERLNALIRQGPDTDEFELPEGYEDA
jgi:phage terminase small subunit